MKKIFRLITMILALSTILLCGCQQPKSYETLEEWYNDGSELAVALDDAMPKNTENGTYSFHVKENIMVYSFEYYEVVFTDNEDVNKLYRSMLDDTFEADEDVYLKLIDMVSEESGIPADEISLRFQYLNPGASTASYIKTFTK